MTPQGLIYQNAIGLSHIFVVPCSKLLVGWARCPGRSVSPQGFTLPAWHSATVTRASSELNQKSSKRALAYVELGCVLVARLDMILFAKCVVFFLFASLCTLLLRFLLCLPDACLLYPRRDFLPKECTQNPISMRPSPAVAQTNAQTRIVPRSSRNHGDECEHREELQSEGLEQFASAGFL